MTRNILFSFILFLLCLNGKSSILFANQYYTIAPTPNWVENIVADMSTLPTTDEVANTIQFLLVDRQIKVDKEKVSYYRHVVKKVVQREGIEEVAKIEIEFNPSHEEIVLHQLVLHRGSQTFNQLKPQNIKIFQKEEKLEKNIYKGIKSICFFLEDVREGDIIEYKVSMIDKKPELHFFHRCPLSSSTPTSRIRHRLLWPKERPLSINNLSTNNKYKKNILDEKIEYIWEVQNPLKVEIEKDMPIWCDPYPYIEIADKQSWGDVAAEELNLYKSPKTISEKLRKYIKNILKLHKSSADQFISVMRFIQDEVRYTGISGYGVIQPNDPSLVFQRRFGDCKDKAFLATIILKELGIEAYPVLVNTEDHKFVRHFLPSTNIFNHVIVVAIIDGKHYWLDPTQTFQRGSLENLSPPDYGYGLIISPKTTDLTEIPSLRSSVPLKEVYETFDLRQGSQAPGTFSIKTIYKGYFADLRREYLSSTSKKDMAKYFLEYYQELYPSIRSLKEPCIDDDIVKNQITVLEEYTIEEAWAYDELKKAWVINFYTKELYPYLDTNFSSQRKFPLSIAHPVNFFKQVRVLLPEKNWEFSSKSETISDRAYVYKKQETYKNNVYTFSQKFKTLKDHIEPRKLTAYIEKIDQIKELVFVSINDYVAQNEANHNLTSTGEIKDHLNWSILVLLIFVTSFFIFITFKLYSYRPNYQLVALDNKYKGIKGLLLMPIFDLFITFCHQIITLANSSKVVLSLNYWNALSDPTRVDFHSFMSTFILAEILGMLAIIIFSFFLLILIFKRKRSVPLLYISFIWTTFLYSLADNFLGWLLFSTPVSGVEIAELGNIGIFVLIWTLYFLKSKRVKATFVED